MSAVGGRSGESCRSWVGCSDAGTSRTRAADDLAQANSIFVWEPGGGRPPVDAVVEVSVTAKSGDVDRAVARAHVLAKTGVASRAVALSDAVD